MKVLVSCYACSPYQGSEPGMGWNFVNCLSKYHELHIITEGKFETDIRRFFCENPEREKDFHFYFIWKNRHKKLRKIWPPSYYWFYKAWQKKAYKLAVELNDRERFDVIHQLNMVGYREPGYMWKINKPLVWGPIGGLGKVPWSLIPTMNLRGMVFYTFHNVINNWQMHFNRRVHAAMNNAAALIAATADTQIAIKKIYGRESVIIPEVGLVGNANNEISRRNKKGEKLKICWSGLHIPRKSLNLLLEALDICDCNNIELHIIGEGTETAHWKKMAQELQLRNIVWHGWVERAEAIKIMQGCHLFCITSLSDLTSTVILEALSFGLPVVTLDHCGFSNVVTEKSGLKIPIINKKQVVSDFSKAIILLESDEDLRYKLAQGAQKRSLDYNWDDKAKTINKIYESVSVQNI